MAVSTPLDGLLLVPSYLGLVCGDSETRDVSCHCSSLWRRRSRGDEVADRRSSVLAQYGGTTIKRGGIYIKCDRAHVARFII